VRFLTTKLGGFFFLTKFSQVAVVTGGGSGIGTMIATAYVQNGAKVYIASRKEKQLKEVRFVPHTSLPTA
jgi:NADP-dependent 3-hydroxy acid dehydrogenase YdfG